MNRSDFATQPAEPPRAAIDWDHYRNVAVSERSRAIARFPGHIRAMLGRALAGHRR